MYKAGDVVEHIVAGGVSFDAPTWRDRHVPAGELAIVVDAGDLRLAHRDGTSYWGSLGNYWKVIPPDQLTEAQLEEVVRIKLAHAMEDFGVEI